MALASAFKPSFSGGEISPRLYGRADISRYAVSAEAIENFIVRPEGGLMRRHGTRFAGESKDHTRKTRLQPFIFSTVQAYMLEFGHNYIRIWKDNAPVAAASNAISGITKANPAVLTYVGADNFANGDRAVVTGVAGMGQVNNREFQVAGLNAGANTFQLSGIDSTGYDTYVSGGTVSKILEVVSPYAEADLDGLFFTQSADTLYIASPSFAPRTLVRASDTSWTLSVLPLLKGPFAPRNLDDTKHVFLLGGSSYAPGQAWTLQSNADIFVAGHVGSLIYIEERYPSDNAVSPWEPGKAMLGTLGTQVSSNGNVYELSNAGNGTNTGTSAPVHTEGEAFDGQAVAGNTYRGWRYLHSRYVIAEIVSFSTSKSVGITLKTRMPNGLAPVSKGISAMVNSGGLIRCTSNGHGYGERDYVFVSGALGTVEANGSWPIINVTANTFDLEGSAFVNAYGGGGLATRYATWLWRFGAFSPARGYPAVVALHEQRLCFANTTLQPYGLWASASGDYSNFLPGTKDADSIAYNVAGNQVDPIRWLASSSDLVIGTLAQEYAAYGGGQGDPITPTNTRIVPQSGEGSNAVQPAKVAGEIMFANRAGRRLFALQNRSDVAAYVASDLLELAEHLTIGKTIKQMAWAKSPASLLWVRLSDGSLCSLTYRREQEVWAWSRHPIMGTVESIAVIPSMDGLTDELWLSIARTINGGTKRYIEYLAAPHEPTSPTDKDLMGFVDSGLRYSGAAVSTVQGLFHLEGQTVKVVANNAVHPDRTVTGGKITLDAATYTNVWVGLAYTSRVRTLRLEVPAVGTAQGRTRRIPRVTVRVMNAIGGKIGPANETTMEDLVKREADDPTDTSPPMRSGDYDAYFASDFDTEGKLAIVQDEPMPLDILAIMPIASVAGEG